MHPFRLLLVGLLLGLTFSCNKKTIQRSEARIEKADGAMISMVAMGYGDSERNAITDAKKRAFETLILQGVPNTAQQYPMASSDQEKRQANAFIAREEYEQFITGMNVVSGLEKNKVEKTKQLQLALDINLFGLRRHLEKLDATSKFGY